MEPLLRQDQRQSSHIRPIACEYGVISSADGSVKYSQGDTFVIVSIHGPKPTTHREENIGQAHIEVCFKPAGGTSDARCKYLESEIHDAFQGMILSYMHPRTTIQIVIQVIVDAGSLLSTSINAVTLALMDASVPMKAFLVSSTCIQYKNQSLIDPTLEEAIQATFRVESSHSLPYAEASDDSAANSLVRFQTNQPFSSNSNTLNKCLDMNYRACVSVHTFMKLSLGKRKA